MTTASIFVSSVQKELAEERRALKAFVEGDALLRRFFTVFLFEDLPAADAKGLRKGSKDSSAPEHEKGARRARTAQPGVKPARAQGTTKRTKGPR